MHGTHNVTLTHCNTMHSTHNVKLLQVDISLSSYTVGWFCVDWFRMMIIHQMNVWLQETAIWTERRAFRYNYEQQDMQLEV